MRNRLLHYCTLIIFLCALLCFAFACTDNNKNKLQISEKEVSLAIGDEHQFSVKTKALEGTASWDSSNLLVATISDNGLLVALREGDTTITVSCGEFSDTCAVTVTTGGILPSVEFGAVLYKNDEDMDELKVTYTDEINFDAYVSFNGKKFDDANFFYTVADKEIGEVSNTGVFHPKKMGKTEVVVSASWRGVESLLLTKKIIVAVVPNIVMDFDNGDVTSLTLYATNSFAGRTYPTEKILTVRAIENNIEQSWMCVSDNDIISVEKISADEILVKQNSYGEANIVLSYTNENQETVSSLLPVIVERPLAEYKKSVLIASANGDLAKSGEFDVEELFNGQPISSVLYNGAELPFAGTVLNYDFTLKENETATATFEVYGEEFGYEINVDIYQNVICSVDELFSMVPGVDKTVDIVDGKEKVTYLPTYSHGSWALGCDIDIEGIELPEANPKGQFTGLFDGRGYKISHMTPTATWYGFFDRIAGTVRNFALTNVQIPSSAKTIIGYEILNGGLVEDIYIQIDKIETTNRFGLLYTATGAGGVMRNVIVESCEAKGFETKGGIIYGYAASNFALTTLENIYVISNEVRLAANGDTSPYTLVVAANDYVENGVITLYGTPYNVVDGQVEIGGKVYGLSQFRGVRRYVDYKSLLGNDFSSFDGYWSVESGLPIFNGIQLKGVFVKPQEATVCVPELAKVYAYVGTIDGEIVWSVSDESIATIDENGILTPKKVGKVTVTCSAGSYSDSCEIEFVLNGDLQIRLEGIYDDALDLQQGEKFRIQPNLYDGEIQTSNTAYSVSIANEQICALKETATGYRIIANETEYGVTTFTVYYEYYGEVIEKTVKVGVVPEFVLNLNGKEAQKIQIYTLPEFAGKTYVNAETLGFEISGSSDVVIQDVYIENEEIARIEDGVLIGGKVGSSSVGETKLVVEMDYKGFTLYRVIDVVVNRPVANYGTTIERFSVENGYVVDKSGEIVSLVDLIKNGNDNLLDSLIYAEQENAKLYIENACLMGVKIAEDLSDYEQVTLTVYDETKGYRLTLMCATQIITTAQELQAIIPNADVDGVLTEMTRTGFYVLGKDVDVSTLKNGMIRGALQKSIFSGVFDGEGHTIDNLNYGTGSGHYGLFGTIKGTVRNFAITNVSLRMGQTALGYKLLNGTAENLYIQITKLNSDERCGVLYTTDKRGQMKNVVIESVGSTSLDTQRGGIIFGYETADFTQTYLENVYVISEDMRLAQNTVKKTAPWHIAVAGNDYVYNGEITFYGEKYQVEEGFLTISGKSHKLLNFTGVTRYDSIEEFGQTKVGAWQYDSTLGSFKYIAE